MTLRGREETVKDFLACPEKIVLLVGDSGIGKSEVLREGQERTENAEAPEPVGLRSAPGSLQRGLLESLGSVVVEITEDASTAQRVGRHIVEFSGRVTDLGLKDLAAGIGRQLLGIAASRVSPEFAAFLSDFATQLITPVDSELLNRINSSSDPDVVDLICEFAVEVRELAEGRDLFLSLDNGERLDNSDRRRLADLLEQLPDGVTIRIAFSTWNSRTRDEADELVQRGLGSVELESLDEKIIRGWLRDEGLDEGWAPTVLQTTNGYPLHVDAAIGLLRETRDISALRGMKRPQVFAAATQRVWRDLDPTLKVEAGRLCAFSAPLSNEEAANYLGLDLDVWVSLRGTLVDSRVFTGQPPWFHELRRRCIWDEILDEDGRIESRRRAIDFLKQKLELPAPTSEMFVQYARLVSADSAEGNADPKYVGAVEADVDEVAIAAALIELVEPGQSAFNAETVLLYAHQIFGAAGDFASALQRLSDRGFVYIASNQLATVLVPTWASVDVINVFIGRAAAELGRLPVPQRATAVFEAALRPLLGAFRSATYGSGYPGIGELSQMALKLQRVQGDGKVIYGKMGPNLILRLRSGDLPLYAALAYDAEEERDAAVERLAQWVGVVEGDDLDIIDCLVSPEEAIPSLRFFGAMERLTGKSLVNVTNGPSSHPPKMVHTISLDEEMRLRAETIEVVRRLSTNEERRASSLESQIGYLYRGDEGESETIQVIGRTGATRLDNNVSARFGDPLYRVEVSVAETRDGERLGLASWHKGAQRADPVINELTRIFKKVARFNESQQRVLVVLDRESLESRIEVNSSQVARDGLELRSNLNIEVSEDELVRRGLRGSKTCVLLQLDQPDPHWVPGARANAIVAFTPNSSGQHAAEVHIIGTDTDGAEKQGSLREVFAREFGLDLEDIDNLTMGVAIDRLAELMGYRSSEIRFLYPQGEASTV